uniref:COX assembly mitochondrial protein n=1 Tax=Chromera velia CCMP2878 TaxID=1169474 RepID=A0A0G4IEE0_9ALVE|mmetsp:Transcript_31860/g.63096  ORF Transcript_31860/g.63096 Transcript_31860/m.63096 type:complete len:214 (+) Transcript_31860:178-819(+)|eukprot:Cvel_13580.t1-p1 / transcript=Cvel_13580.t1 / gene=Cvel_13580 / organism=Chromera_velia_CCMP2878 / gene_product=hypothetical protein / transcript_product=hypothetical protein / location=Cvel_scaffold933:33681-37462(+) / protein_length=213 / sequence_SO=supercontig / SO=protein_coding / is_pseudo=false
MSTGSPPEAGGSSTKPSFFGSRIPYYEIRELVDVEEREKKEAQKILGFELRDKCRSEIDEYLDCTIDRFLTISQCLHLNRVMRRCLMKYETREFVDKRTAEITKEREEKGLDLIQRKLRAKHNVFFDDEWLPPRPGEQVGHRHLAAADFRRKTVTEVDRAPWQPGDPDPGDGGDDEEPAAPQHEQTRAKPRPRRAHNRDKETSEFDVLNSKSS